MNLTNWTLKSDVLAKVKQDGNNLRFAAPELQADHDVVIEAFKETEESFYFACQSLKKDEHFALQLLQINHQSLNLFPELHIKNKALIIYGIQNVHPGFIRFDEELILNNPKYNVYFLNGLVKYLRNGGMRNLQLSKRLRITENRFLSIKSTNELAIYAEHVRNGHISIEQWDELSECYYNKIISKSLNKLDRKNFLNLEFRLKSNILALCSKNKDVWEAAVLKKGVLDSDEGFNLVLSKLSKITSCGNGYHHIDSLFTCAAHATKFPQFEDCHHNGCPLYEDMGQDYSGTPF